MRVKIAFICLLTTVLSLPASLFAQPDGTVSYKIDGKAFECKNGRLEYSPEDEYVSLECSTTEIVTDPSALDSKREVSVGMSIQLSGDEKSFAGTHEVSGADEMPVYFSWYELKTGMDGKSKEIKRYEASLDSEEAADLKMVVHIESFGPVGSLVKGTFSGKLLDEEGKVHQVSDGTFCLTREDTAE